MTQSFSALVAPRSVALIGASDKSGSVGALTLKNLERAGFEGRVFLVNPRHAQLNGHRVYPDIESLPEHIDLAVVATPPGQVPGVIRDLGLAGTKAAVVLTAGFGETGERGKALQDEMIEAAEPYGLRIVGPNCVGVIVPGIGLNASFAQNMPAKGQIGFVSQSGALVTVVLDWAQAREVGFSQIISLGDMADFDFADALAYLSDDPSTSAIVLYMEGLKESHRFMAAAQVASRRKPVLVLKVGRHAEGAKAAHSHTGALAGSDVVYDAAFRRAGMLRLDSMPELFDAIETLDLTFPSSGNRLAIMTNGGGPGVIATDALISAQGSLAELSPSTIERLNAILPTTWSHGDPIDMIGDSPPEDYAKVLEILLQDQGIDGILAMHAPTALADPKDAARSVIACVQAARAAGSKRNVYTAWLGERLVAPARRLFNEARIPTYDTAEDAVQGFIDRWRYAQSQSLLSANSPSAKVSVDSKTARACIERVIMSGRRWLDADEVSCVLQAYGIPALRSCSVADADAAGKAATEIGGPVALKIRSQQLTHKSDVGGVVLNLRGADRVREEALAMLSRIKAAKPGAIIDGFLVQEMAYRTDAFELIVGTSVDAVFGPVILFGQGGTAVELIADSSLELTPLTPEIARTQMSRTRVWKLLQGYRDKPSADIDAIANVLTSIGQLAVDQHAIQELDINPLLADHRGVVAVDVRIMLIEQRIK